jgi:hypothetical protein
MTSPLDGIERPVTKYGTVLAELKVPHELASVP